MPPPTDFLKAWFETKTLHDSNAYANEVRHNYRTMMGQIQTKRGNLHYLLERFKPVDMPKLRADIDRLNAEKEQIVFELRVLECKGFKVDFDSVI
jgi:hypothetical protein